VKAKSPCFAQVFVLILLPLRLHVNHAHLKSINFLLVQGMSLGIDHVKNDKNSLKSKDVTNVFLHCHACPWAIIFDVIIFYPHTFKYEES